MSSSNASPGTANIFTADAEVLYRFDFAAQQVVLRLKSPAIARAAQPGSFVHVRCAEHLPMRRPLSVMRAAADDGWIELLFRVVGRGTAALADVSPGDRISLLGPIGQGFADPAPDIRPVLIGGGVGIPPMVFLAQRLRRRAHRPIVLLGSQVPFPFDVVPSGHLLDGVPQGAIASMALLDDWGVPCRLASENDFPGCYPGYVTDLAGHWLDNLDREARGAVRLYACGPAGMLEAVASLAGRFELEADLCLEEFMACGVGGCAGCVVKVASPDGPAMRRVCVDGPVFPARAIYPEHFAQRAD